MFFIKKRPPSESEFKLVFLIDTSILIFKNAFSRILYSAKQ